jgi:hypothetical protein
MRKKIIYAVVTLVVCISCLSFKQVCNDNDVEASYKEKMPVNICPVKPQQELNISPLYNLLEI